MKVSFHWVKMLMVGALVVAVVGCAKKEAATGEAGGEAPAAQKEEAAAPADAAPAKAGMPGLDGVPYIGSDDPKVVILEGS